MPVAYPKVFAMSRDIASCFEEGLASIATPDCFERRSYPPRCNGAEPCTQLQHIAQLPIYITHAPWLDERRKFMEEQETGHSNLA
jgi:hypothetical protein